MTLLFFDGFQDYSIAFKKPEATLQGSNITHQNGVGRDGSTGGAYSMLLNSGTGNGECRINPVAGGSPVSAAICYCGIGFKLPALAAHASNWVLGFYTAGDVLQLTIVVNISGFLELRRSNGTGTLLATSTGHAAVTVNNWRHMQARVKLHTSAGEVDVKLDGVTVLTYSGGATSSVSGDVTAVSMSDRCGSNGSQTYFDDMWICDAVDATATQGRPNNDFLGDLKVSTVVPNGAGDQTDWTPSTGANYAAVDEVPPSTTDYVSLSASNTGDQDLYTMTDLPSAAGTVFGMRGQAYAMKSDVGEAIIKQIIKENSVISSIGDMAPALDYLAIYSGYAFRRPSDSAVFTVSDVNAMQAGIEVG